MAMADSYELFSLIVPTFNEAENIIGFLESAHAVLADRPHEIIVVDDHSPDGTAALVQMFCKSNSWTRLIVRPTERGLSSAVVRGFNEARGNHLGVMDADRQHDENILPYLLQALSEGTDLAVGSRRAPGGGIAMHWPWYRRLASALATWMARSLLTLPLSDPMSGYFVLQRSVYDHCRAELRPCGYKILLEICAKAHPRSIKEVPFIFKERAFGESKLTGSVMWDYLRMLFVLKWKQMTHRHDGTR
jgi:dolichol-phosphate mannosyltransferase